MHRALSSSVALALLCPAALSQQTIPEDVLMRAVPGSLLSVDAGASRDVELADLDNDGDIDVLVARGSNQNDDLFWNTGAGQFSRATVGPLVNTAATTRDVALGDVDGDGDLDVFMTRGPGSPNSLFVNRGGAQGGATGVFELNETSVVSNDDANSRRAAFGDIDNDGDLDLFVANSSEDDNFLYVNQGGVQGGTEGEFVRVLDGAVVHDGGVSHEGAFGDIDGDGDLDLFVANHGGVVGGPGALDFLYLNDGLGGFTPVLTGAVVSLNGHSLCAGLADIDRDGDLDLFVGNNQGQDDRLFLNDGRGDFTPVTTEPLVAEGGETKACRFGDVDYDGDMDLLVSRRQGQLDRLFLNDGEGHFVPQALGPLTTEVGETHALGLGDLDGDGFFDIVVAKLDEPDAVYRGLGRQWKDHGGVLPGSTGSPRLFGSGNFMAGLPVNLALKNAAPSAPALLVLGLSRIKMPFKGGVLVPAPDLVFALASNALGEANAGGTIPAGVPSGLHLAFQFWLPDAGGPKGLAATNALSAITP